MNNSNTCICCGTPLEGQVCKYCGYMNVIALDEDAEMEKVKKARGYRSRLIAKLSDFSIVSYQYGWKEEESKFGLLGTKMIRLADGKDCFREIFWTSPEFGQNPNSANIARSVELSYKFNGKMKKAKCDINPVQCDSYWHIGLEITSKLRLIVYLGGKEKSAKSRLLNLDLS